MDNGHLVLSVPFVYREHEQPYDFRRFTSFGIIKTLEENGFEIAATHKCLGNFDTIAMLLNCEIAKDFNVRSRGHFLLGSICILLISRLARVVSRFFPSNGELYSCLVVVATKSIREKKH